MTIQQIKFDKIHNGDFIKALRKKVNDYFKANNISRFANTKMVVKTIVLVGGFLLTYGILLSGWFSSVWAILLLWIVLGLFKAGIGFSVMHDANHGAYSRNQTVNKLLGTLINLIGGFALNWRIQHNVLHHSFTNIHGADEDIDPGKVLRFSPYQKRYWYHRFQHFYAWFLYGLSTISWATTKDFEQLIRYEKDGLLATQNIKYKKALFELVLAKAIYYGYLLVIPLLVLDIPWYLTILFFLIMHFVLGLTITAVFQTAHVVTDAEFYEPGKEGKMENNWAIHQLKTTANFAPKSRIMSWFIGGLNYQIEHHLFPNICHVHYPALSRIVRETAREFGLPYHVQPTFAAALWQHALMLRQLGRS